jgi:DtxR family Mn-dependent transcriptional regulator
MFVDMPSATVENYLKCILMLSIECEQAEVPMGLIANSLGVTPGTATSMMKNLQREKWLTYNSWFGLERNT